MFESLLKYSRVQFEEGSLGFLAGGAFWLYVALLALIVVGMAWMYRRSKRYRSTQHKIWSLGLRLGALGLLALPLFEPVLITPMVVPDENFVAVMVDASSSMSIEDGATGNTRFAQASKLLFDETVGLFPALNDHFKLRLYSFSDEALRADSLSNVPTGTSTNLTTALDRVMADFKGLPLTGIVLLTDGGDNSNDRPQEKAEVLRSLDVPLHIVGLGKERIEPERELLDVAVTTAVEQTTGAEIDVKVRSWANEPTPVDIHILQDDQRVFTEQHRLKGSGKIDQFTLFFEPTREGAHEYTVQVAPAENEDNLANNTQNLLINTRKDTLRVLYVEGHLRRDFKFIKRALQDDQVIDFTSVSRTGPGKIYRQGIRSPNELAGGFPTTEAELNQFHAILVGDMEAAAFTPEQLLLIERFVRVRGGGFLMLGGRNSYVEGSYNDTPIADVLPVELDLSRRTVIPPAFSNPNEPPGEQGFAFLPTPAGLESPILKLSPDAGTNRARWANIPGLTSINFLGAVKPGAVVLAEKPNDDYGEREPLLVIQRYGRGRSAALPTASTWRWQMLLPAEDVRHERFFRQLIRWQATGAPKPVDIDQAETRFTPADPVPVAVNVYDDGYAPQSNASVEATLTLPSGQTRNLHLQPALAEDGAYTTTYYPQQEGMYNLNVKASVNGQTIGTDRQHFLVRPSKQEFANATLQRPFLENLATASNGTYYTPDQANTLPDNLMSRRTATSVFQADYLWDMPLLFGLALVLLSIEWITRRRRGLP